MFHGIILHGWEAQNHRVSVKYLLGVLAFNTAGALTYGTEISREGVEEEDWSGGGERHQIMHVAVVCMRPWVHLFGLVRDFDHALGSRWLVPES